MLALQGLSRRFGDVVALDDLGFRVPRGQLHGFVGPNGAGKTTAMRIVLGVLEPDAGSVSWDDRPVTTETRAGFGYMPEERGLYPKMRVADQLTYMARLHGLDAGAARSAAVDWIERLGLADRADTRVEELSLGNQQRVQLGAALVHSPALLVLDEPFSGLDPGGVDVLAEVLAERARDGAAVVFSSHQLELVERLCDAVSIVNNGRLVASGEVAGLRARHGDAAAGGRGRGRPGGLVARRARRAGGPGAQRRRGADRGARRRRPADPGRRGGGRARAPVRLHPAHAGRGVPRGGGHVSFRTSMWLVARREITERVRERSFLVSGARDAADRGGRRGGARR